MAGTTSGVKFTERGDDLDMTLFQGKTVSFEYVWADEDSIPIDVTGWTSRMQLRSSYESVSPVVEFTVANSRVTVGTTDGKFTFVLSASDSAALPTGSGVYDVEVTDSAGKVMQAFSGKYTIQREVTR